MLWKALNYEIESESEKFLLTPHSLNFSPPPVPKKNGDLKSISNSSFGHLGQKVVREFWYFSCNFYTFLVILIEETLKDAMEGFE